MNPEKLTFVRDAVKSIRGIVEIIKPALDMVEPVIDALAAPSGDPVHPPNDPLRPPVEPRSFEDFMVQVVALERPILVVTLEEAALETLGRSLALGERTSLAEKFKSLGWTVVLRGQQHMWCPPRSTDAPPDQQAEPWSA